MVVYDESETPHAWKRLECQVVSLVNIMQVFGLNKIMECCFKNGLHFFMIHPYKFQRRQPASIKIMV